MDFLCLERQLAPESNKLTGGEEQQVQESREGKLVSTKFFVNKHYMNKQVDFMMDDRNYFFLDVDVSSLDILMPEVRTFSVWAGKYYIFETTNFVPLNVK